MTLTKEDLKQIVKALEPKFKEIDDRFIEMSLEIGDMFNDVHSDAAVFQSRTLQRFDDIEKKLLEHDVQFERIIHQLSNHDHRLANLEKTA